jgi:RHS repeat-associated protein
MKVHNLNPETTDKLTFTTELTYDGFGRLATLTYDDAEVVTHDYDSGGLLRSMAGAKGEFDYAYVNRLEYDEFLVRKFLEAGNGVQTVYNFDAETRRLARQVTDTPVREVQDLNYTYDLVGNVLRLDNTVPAPQSDLMVGPSTQTYEYDPYYRLVAAEGTYAFAPGKTRTYDYDISYDDHGNIVTKKQTDTVFNSPGKKGLVQKPTSYDYSLQYASSRPHVLTKVAQRPYTFDLNGNFTGWTDPKTGQYRAVTWDATNHARSVQDQGATTRYTYDEQGQLAIERGPEGETSFVNRWYTVRNGSVPWKHVWAGDDRLAIKRSFDVCPPEPPVVDPPLDPTTDPTTDPDAEPTTAENGGSTDGDDGDGDGDGEVDEDCGFEHMVYFLHKDLQGSTNVITDGTGLVFEHLEYFPGGEIWVLEHSTIHRTMYLYAGGYLDEFRNLLNLGQRWYEPREQFLYSPDPVLVDDPWQVIDDPGLLPAYSYAGSNPLRFADVDGRAPTWVQAKPAQALAAATWQRTNPSPGAQAARSGGPKLGAAREVYRGSRLWKALVRFAHTERAKKLADFSDRFDAKPLVEVNFVKSGDGWGLKDVKLSPTFGFKQFTVAKGTAGQTDAQAGADSTPTNPGANTGQGPGAAQGGPPSAGPGAAGPGGAPPGGAGGPAAGNAAPPQPAGGPALGGHRGANPVPPSAAN